MDQPSGHRAARSRAGSGPPLQSRSPVLQTCPCLTSGYPAAPRNPPSFPEKGCAGLPCPGGSECSPLGLSDLHVLRLKDKLKNPLGEGLADALCSFKEKQNCRIGKLTPRAGLCCAPYQKLPSPRVHLPLSTAGCCHSQSRVANVFAGCKCRLGVLFRLSSSVSEEASDCGNVRVSSHPSFRL